MLLANGELHPNEFQPTDAKSVKQIAAMQDYTKHTLAE
jgi:hypothetical protein